MKRIYLTTAALVVTAVVATSALSQTRPGVTVPRPTPAPTPVSRPLPAPTPPINLVIPTSKIAFIDTTMFGDEKAGITRYVNNMKALQREFQAAQAELNNLQNRLTTLANEINTLSKNAVVDNKAIQMRQSEGERVQTDFKRKKEDYDALFDKRYEAVMGPLTAEIGKALDQFAARNGITALLDLSKIGPALLTAVPATDLTQAFISDFNSRYPTPR